MKLLKLFLVLAIIFSVGCVNQKLTPKKSGEVETDQTQTAEPAIYQIGDVIEIGDEKLTVHNAADYIEPYEWLAPESGKHYFAVEVTVENLGQNDINYHPEEFQLKDERGYSYNISYFGKQTPSIDAGTLAPGQTARGYITFQVLNDAGSLELIFKPKWWNTGQVVIKL